MSYNECQARCGVGAGTITRIVERANVIGRSVEELQNAPPSEIEELFYPKERARRKQVPEPDFDALYRHRARAGPGSRITIRALFNDYRKLEPDGYGYTQFAAFYNQWYERVHGPKDARMLKNRSPGEVAYIDWVGDQPALLLDPETGKPVKVHLFVGTIGISSFGFAGIYPDEKEPSFQRGVADMLTYFGGVPPRIVCDNMKTAVTKHTKDEIALTMAVSELEDYYGFIMIPGKPHTPRAKGPAENFVRYVETSVIQEMLLETPYSSLEEAHSRCAELVDVLNDTVQGAGTSRRARFESLDLPYLRPLPPEPFEVWDALKCACVPSTYHVTFDHHRYSVPCRFIGQDILVRANAKNVVMSDINNQQIASHERVYDSLPEVITDPAHRPPDHRFRAEVEAMNGDQWRDWADTMGPCTRKVLDAILGSVRHEEQMYENFAPVYMTAKDLSAEIVEEAAKRCLQADELKPTYFKKCLRMVEEERRIAKSTQSSTENYVRGKEYYK